MDTSQGSTDDEDMVTITIARRHAEMLWEIASRSSFVGEEEEPSPEEILARGQALIAFRTALDAARKPP